MALFENFPFLDPIYWGNYKCEVEMSEHLNDSSSFVRSPLSCSSYLRLQSGSGCLSHGMERTLSLQLSNAVERHGREWDPVCWPAAYRLLGAA